MNAKLKYQIEEAIDKVIADNCETPSWEGMIHPQLARQMTNAAEQVFDAAMDAQQFAQEEGA